MHLENDPPEISTDAVSAINPYAYFTKNVTGHSPVNPKDELNTPVKVKPAPNDWISYNKDDIYYKINDGRDKIAIIFNHYTFDSTGGRIPTKRKGTEVDCERLTKCLTEKLGFTTTVYQDPELFTIRKTINEGKTFIYLISYIVSIQREWPSPDPCLLQQSKTGPFA